jgi:xylulokinase
MLQARGVALLGIDVGTTGSRALVLDETGRTASASADHDAFRSLQTGWAEQDPDDWWRACQLAVRGALAASGTNGAAIQAIGLSGQMHGAVLMDATGAVLRPAIIWCDQRTESECRWIESTVGASRLLELTSNPALTNFTLTKLLWVRAHEPETWARVRHVLLPKDYVRWRLSGEQAIDVADASGTLMLDVARRRWSPEVLEQVGIDAELLPPVFESPEICARVSRDAAAAIGVPVGTPIVAGAGDQAAGAVGMGITRPGAVSATIGTSGVVFAATDRPVTDPRGRLHTFCHAVPGRWHVMGVTQAAGLSLRWLRDLIAGNGDVTYDEMTAEAARVSPGADGVLWRRI